MNRLIVACLLFVASACSGGGSDGAGGVEMTSDQAFTPRTTTITAGETVTWDNGSSEHHTVTSEEDSVPPGAEYFASGDATDEDAANDEVSDDLVAPGESYAHTFEIPGTYRYYCIPHKGAGMRGTIVVTAD